jgi:branched-chain amino acid transport system permease protein
VAFAANWLIYRIMLEPLVKRAKNRGPAGGGQHSRHLRPELCMVGIMLAVFGGDYFNYSYLAQRIVILDNSFAQNRVVAFLMASLIWRRCICGSTARAPGCRCARSRWPRPRRGW